MAKIHMSSFLTDGDAREAANQAMAIQNDLFQARDSDDSGYHSVYHLKVQNSTHAVLQGMKRRELLLALKRGNVDDVEEDCSENLLGKPTRFYYEDLKAITGNFSEVLGEGGFGKVFEGILLDGIKMAVTQLDGSSPVRKSFLTWVEANGSIHHVNLVRLIGFCNDELIKLLVYEHMSNGHQKKKIILDIAKGLAYLHEECRRKIIHLNTKPQNILLDDNFNAKIPGSGLSKLEQMHLLNHFEKKEKENRLLDLVYIQIQDMRFNRAEMMTIMRVAAWCLLSDYAKRPSMSMVVNFLEDDVEFEGNLDNSSSNPALETKSEEKRTAITLLLLTLPITDYINIH
uniref:Protein kinase domain-containing protein n=1 Tax=Salix viminalis TaxID=40686 RepID=A0A6N2MY79_SALVM